MKNAEIARILNISRSAVTQISKGNKNFSKYKIERVMFYKDFEVNVVEDIFNDTDFIDICEFVIAKTTNRDGKNYDEIIRFATMCLRWSDVFTNGRDPEKLDSIMIASLNKEPYQLFTDEMFWVMMNVVIKRCKNSGLRLKASTYQDISQNIRKARR